MPKTKDAFALGDFDAQRILQRRWFKDFDLARGKDEDILLSFLNVCEKPIEKKRLENQLKKANSLHVFLQAIFSGLIPPGEKGYLEGMLKNLDTITRLADRAGVYEARIERHMKRLNGMQKIYVEKFLPTEDKTYKQKFERTTELIKSYREVLNSITALREKISLKEEMANQSCKYIFRKYYFGSRLREARKAAGMTQQQLADRVGLRTYAPITQYERGINDPSILTLIRLSAELKCSADWLLGLK